jgi:hypothetical protein
MSGVAVIPSRVTYRGKAVPEIIIDSDMFDIVSRHSWFLAGGGPGGVYPTACIKYKPTLLHRFVWMHKRGEVPPIIDHIDRNPLNATIANLRSATPSLNARNANIGRGKFLPGAYKVFHRWTSQICVNGKHIYLGMFATEQDAHEAYMRERNLLLSTGKEAINE